MVAPGGNDSVQFYVDIEAEAAVRSLRSLLDNAGNLAEKVKIFSAELTAMAQQLNVPWTQLLNTFRQINAESTRTHGKSGPSVVGNVGIGGTAFLDAVENYKKGEDAAVNFGNASEEALDKVDKGSKRAVRGLDAVRIAMGAIVAMIVFRAIEAVQNFFTQAIEGARKLELAIYNLGNAERIISEAGVGITPKDLQDITKEVEKLVPIFSHVDVSNAVAGIALFTKDLKLSKEQIEDLSKSIAVLTVRNRAFGLSFEQVRSQVLTGLLTGRAQGIRDLGVSVSETTIQAEALRLGLVKTKEEFDSLSGEMEANVKAQALVSIITKSTAGEMNTLNDYLKTSDARIEANKAAWTNYATTVGTVLTNLIPDISGAIEKAQAGVERGGLQKLFIQGTKEMAISLADRTNILLKLGRGAELSARELNLLKDALKGLSQQQITDIFPDPSLIKDAFASDIIKEFITSVDTATASADDFATSIDSIKAALDAVDIGDFLSDIEKLQQRLEELQSEFNEKLRRMGEDFNTDQRRALEDYQRQVANTLQDFADKRHDAEMNYRLKEQEAEARFQENMRQLREKFLFSLEDALRERDARQVLRLIKEYQMEKTGLTNEEKLRREAAAREHAEEMARLRREEAERLAQLAQEYETKKQRAIEDYNLRVAREKEEYEQDKAKLEEQIKERLEQFAKAIADELGLKADGAKKIYDVLFAYYGKGGLFDALYAYSIGSMTANAQALLEALSQLAGQMQSAIPSSGIGGSQNFPRNTGGGVLGSSTITPPTGDTGLGDLLNQPLSSITSSVQAATGPVPLPSNNGGGVGGSLSMRILLSNGLVAEIVDQSLENVSTIIEEVQRSR